MKAEQIPRRVRLQVHHRSGGYCEVCARQPASQIHHRRPRKTGGSRRASTNTPANLLDVCTRCHDRIESHRARAVSFGWLVPDAVEAPNQMPVWLRTSYGEQYVYLDDAGGKEVADIATDVARALLDTTGPQPRQPAHRPKP